MEDSNNSKLRRKHSTVSSIVNMLEWMVTALILALTFRAFVVEAYKIPTGSMAPTLRGDHFEIACPECGYEYDHGFPMGRIRPANLYHVNTDPKCPNCGHYCQRPILPKSGGDRILVFKCGYHFSDPKRWDVFVFKNPTEPRINYIKRVIGRPGEKVEIVDGDIFINDRIARKPKKVQDELWMEIYNNDFQPVNGKGNFNYHDWKQPFVNLTDSHWNLKTDNNKTFTLDSDKINTIEYDTNIGNDFRATYAYNSSRWNNNMPVCSDIKVEYEASIDSENSLFGAKIEKYGREYIATVDSAKKTILLSKDVDGKLTELKKLDIEQIPLGKIVQFKFTLVDHMLALDFGPYKGKLKYDLGDKRGDLGKKQDSIKPEVKIFGSGKITLKHISLWRDIYYMSHDVRDGSIVRAGESNPFTLGKDEFFACGDNSPGSADSRLWNCRGFGNNGDSFPIGVVPRKYLVGKAFYVYWPSGYKLSLNPKFAKGILKFPLIPNISKMRLIYGGK